MRMKGRVAASECRASGLSQLGNGSTVEWFAWWVPQWFHSGSTIHKRISGQFHCGMVWLMGQRCWSRDRTYTGLCFVYMLHMQWHNCVALCYTTGCRSQVGTYCSVFIDPHWLHTASPAGGDPLTFTVATSGLWVWWALLWCGHLQWVLLWCGHLQWTLLWCGH